MSDQEYIIIFIVHRWVQGLKKKKCMLHDLQTTELNRACMVEHYIYYIATCNFDLEGEGLYVMM